MTDKKKISDKYRSIDPTCLIQTLHNFVGSNQATGHTDGGWELIYASANILIQALLNHGRGLDPEVEELLSKYNRKKNAAPAPSAGVTVAGASGGASANNSGPVAALSGVATAATFIGGEKNIISLEDERDLATPPPSLRCPLCHK